MLSDDLGAVLMTVEGMRISGRAVAWLSSDEEEATRYCDAEGLPNLNFPTNTPWSGVFVGEGDSSPSSAIRVVMHSENCAVVAQTFRQMPGSSGFQLGSSRLGGAALGGGQAPRWMVEFTGEDTPPEQLLPVRRRSVSSDLIGADTVRLWRERALNLVEELAGERIGSDDPNERAGGELARAAVSALRPYVDREIGSDRREAWQRVMEAAIDFISKGREGRNLVRALGELAGSYGLRVGG